MTKHLNRSGRFVLAAMGACLSLGAPLGWLVIQWLQGTGPATVVRDSPQLVIYLLVPTMLVFGLAGYLLGLQWEKLARANERLKMLATRDGLTGLFNTRRFWEDVQRENIRSRRHHQSLYVLVIDLDHFKAVNDTHGHLVGDEVLKAVSRAMSDELRGEETLYRVGGEEFSVLLIDVTSAQAKAVGERLRRAVETLDIPVGDMADSDFEPTSIGVTISVGVAGRTQTQSQTPQSIYDRADQALYRAKEAGRNTVKLAAEALLVSA